MTRIAIIDGHPDSDPARYVHALAQAYAEGALEAGHEVRRIALAGLDFPLLKSQHQWMNEPAPPAIAEAQQDLRWAEHVVILYPLWLGDVPALLKAFLEQALRPGFALDYASKGFPRKLLEGRSARLVVTMGMPAFFYSLVYRAHSLKSLVRNILAFTGFGPVRHSIIGGVGGSADRRARWLARVRKLGAVAR